MTSSMMDSKELLLYDSIHQRYSPERILSIVRQLTRLHVQFFVEQFAIAEAINPYYIKTILKILIDNVDLFNEDDVETADGIAVVPLKDIYLTEWIFEKYVELLGVSPPPPTTKDIVQYRLDSSLCIRMEESPRVISGLGTTGFRTWEAALYLAEYLLNFDFQNKNVLELGAGTSLVSATIAKRARDKINTLYITDGDSVLLETISRRNFHLNDLVDDAKFLFRRLLWNEDPIPSDIDLVLAADVTYDSSVVPDLCRCLLQCLTNGRCQQCLVSATIRNEETIKSFENELLTLDLNFTVVSTTETTRSNKTFGETVGRPLIAPIRIYSIQL